MNRSLNKTLRHAALFIALHAFGVSLAAHAVQTQYAIIGDAGKTNSNSKSVRESIIRLGIKQLILPGDNLYNSNYDAVWSPWKSAGLNFDVVAIGNHNGGYQQETSFFGMPGEYFSKSRNETKFIVLNSDNNSSAEAQAKWLDNQLLTATEKFIFLVYHHPTYTISSFHRWEEKRKFQSAIRPVIWKYRSKLTALVVGHDHLASFLHFDDLPVVLSGAVQDVRRDSGINNVQDGVTVRTAWFFDRTPYWARMTVDSDAPQVRVDFIRAKDDRISCSALITPAKSAELQKNCVETGQYVR